MATKKTPKSTLTIVAAYRRLSEIMEEYRSQITDAYGTVEALDKLSKEAKAANLGNNILAESEGKWQDGGVR